VKSLRTIRWWPALCWLAACAQPLPSPPGNNPNWQLSGDILSGGGGAVDGGGAAVDGSGDGFDSGALVGEVGGAIACQSDGDCPTPDPCWPGLCKEGWCTVAETTTCCNAGPCCDLATNTIQPVGKPCGGEALAIEYDCLDATVMAHLQWAACDGASPEGCNDDPEARVWTAWKAAATCAAGQSCVPGASAAEQPTCSGGGGASCVDVSACDDGDPCTLDACSDGACSHSAKPEGAACANSGLGSEYQCSTSGHVQKRTATGSCTADGSCSADQLAWGPWTTWLVCPPGSQCQIADPSQPGVCKSSGPCKPGSTCCTAAGGYAAKATACGTSTVKTEYQCSGGKGGAIQKRTAVAGCSGASTMCSSVYPAWGAWQTVQTCGPAETCTPWSSASSKPTCKAACSPGSACCTKTGDFAPKGTACSTSTAATEYQCSGAGKGGSILQRKGHPGCTGASASCSSSSSSLVWDPWTTYKTCDANEKCVSYSKSSASCQSAGACNPSSTCCTASGDYAPKGTKCGSSASATEYSCSSTAKGGKVLVRKGYGGCTGSSTSCSTSSNNLVWEPWTTYKSCSSSQVCKVTSPSSAGSCVAP
jgi:hypothetical protein